jgi:hypothetical protein
MQFIDSLSMIKSASDRTRTALYIFMVVNFALFFTTYGTVIYNRPKERLQDFLAAALCADPNIKDTEHVINGRKYLTCESANMFMRQAGYDPEKTKESYDQENSYYGAAIKKRIESLVADEVSSKRVQIPLVSFSFDIDYLWLLTSYFGLQYIACR